MAEEDQDLVSKVSIEGLDETTKQLEEFGDKGSESFTKVAEAATAAGVVIPKATAAIEKGAKSAGDSVKDLNKNIKSVDGEPTAKELSKITASTEKLVTGIRKVSKDIFQFTARVAGLATAGTLAVAGIAKLGATLAAQVNQTTSAFDKNNAAQQRAVASSLTAEQASIQYSAQQSELNRQLALGNITYEQYADTLKNNQAAYKSQIKVTAQLQEAQEHAREETERLQKTAADRKAFTDLQETFGGPLLGSLLTLGSAAISVKKKFIEAFGPGLSAFVDVLTGSLDANSKSISGFFESASAKVSAFVNQNAPAIQQALASVGTAIGAIFNGLLEALPSLLSFFNNQLVPAVRLVATTVDTVVQGFNKMFGTDFSTGAAVIIVALTGMTGGFKLLFGMLSLIGPAITVITALIGFLFTPIGLLTAALIALAFAVDWPAFAAAAVNAGRAIVTFFTTFPATILGFFTGLWDSIKAGWDAIIQGVLDGWKAVVDFFATLPDVIGGFFTAVGNAILNAFTTAFNAVRDYIASWAKTIMPYIQPILDGIKAMTKFFGGDGNDSPAPAFAGGGRVTGPGTGTSDEILAWLSNNEFVMKAKAVRKYGSSFMRAVNEGRFDPSSIARFASGGLVNAVSPRPIVLPSLAQVGTRPGGAAMNLSLTIGGEQFDDLIVPDEDTAKRLTRYAVNRQARSAGRKPTWAGKGR